MIWRCLDDHSGVFEACLCLRCVAGKDLTSFQFGFAGPHLHANEIKALWWRGMTIHQKFVFFYIVWRGCWEGVSQAETTFQPFSGCAHATLLPNGTRSEGMGLTSGSGFLRCGLGFFCLHFPVCQLGAEFFEI